MSQEIIAATSADGQALRFALEVVPDGEHWMSTLTRLDAAGNPEAERVAPRFYGLSADQARRRMISILENQYEDVRVETGLENRPL